MLEELKTFLTISTIHGLGWLPISGRYLRIFWIIVVLFGFGVSTYLIVKSFKGWQESPIATSVEVLPITEITFPNVTVCPPKETFTVLNYDVSMVENITLDKNTREQLLEALDEAVIFAGYKDILNDFNIFVEKDRFRNWYNGISRISFPYWTGGSQFKVGLGKKVYKYYSYAVSGEFVTPLYQEPWTDEKFDITSMYYGLFIQKPWMDDENTTNKDVSIVFDIEQDMLSELPGSRWGGRDISHVEEDLVPFEKNLEIVKPVQDEYNIYYDKILTVSGLARIKRTKIPGMKVRWFWNDTVHSNRNYQEENKNFIRLANIVQMSDEPDKVWTFIRLIRLDKNLMKQSNKTKCIENMNKDSDFLANTLAILENKLRIDSRKTSVLRNIKDDQLQIASEMYIYLIYCPNPDYRSPSKNDWVGLFDKMFQNNNQQSIILAMSRIMSEVKEEGAFEYNLALEIFEKVWTVFHLKSKDIATLMMSEIDIMGNVLIRNHYQNISNCFKSKNHFTHCNEGSYKGDC